MFSKRRAPSDHLFSPEFVASRNGLQSFSQVAGYRREDADLSATGGPVRVQWVKVTANLLPMLGISPRLGRGFRGDEEKPGGPDVVLLSNRFWRSYFHADPSVIGRSVGMDGREQTIIGVLPAYFSFPDYSLEPDVYSLVDLPPDTSMAVGKGVVGVSTIARLRPRVTRREAQAEVEAFFLGRGRTYPAAFASMVERRHMVVESLQRHLAGDDRKPLLILLACVIVVLLIACGNVVHLEMARALSRRHEMAVRGALGASRLRLLRQFLAESFALSAVSAASGLGIAWGIIGLIRFSGGITPHQALAHTSRFDVPVAKIASVIHLDGWVLAFTVSLSVLAALLFGLAPAISVARADLRSALQSAVQRITSGRKQRLARHGLLVLEVALAIVLLAGAGLLVRSFFNVLRYDGGFDARDTLTGTTLLGRPRYQSVSDWRKFASQLFVRLQAIPGVQAAALASTIPLGNAGWGAFSLEPNPPAGPGPAARMIRISPDYFHAVGTSLLQGRPFSMDDIETSAPVVIVNGDFARQYFNGDAVGKRFYILHPFNESSGLVATTIVGVVSDVRHNGIEHEVEPEFYVPLSQMPYYNLNLILRSDRDTASLANAMRHAVAFVDHEEPVFDIQTMEEKESSLLSRRRLIVLLVAGFAFLAALLASVGVYGIFTYSLSQRTREMGIRLALGSSRARLLRAVVAQAAGLIGIGSAVGVAAALISTRLLAGMLVGVKVHDPLSFVLAWILMSCVALLASAFPALKAARTDLISVLHAD